MKIKLNVDPRYIHVASNLKKEENRALYGSLGMGLWLVALLCMVYFINLPPWMFYTLWFSALGGLIFLLAKKDDLVGKGLDILKEIHASLPEGAHVDCYPYLQHDADITQFSFILDKSVFQFKRLVIEGDDVVGEFEAKELRFESDSRFKSDLLIGVFASAMALFFLVTIAYGYSDYDFLRAYSIYKMDLGIYFVGISVPLCLFFCLIMALRHWLHRVQAKKALISEYKYIKSGDTLVKENVKYKLGRVTEDGFYLKKV